MSNGRSLRYLAGSLLLLLAFGSLLASAAFANPSHFDWAVSVVTDPLDYSRELSLAPGEFATLYVVGDQLTPQPGVGLRAIQFAVEVDPRLTVLSRNPTADVGVALNRGPDEWLLGFTDCVFDASQSYVLMSYLVSLPAGATDTLDISVGVGPLASTGEPLAYTSCVSETLQLPLKNGGRSVINPTPGRILNFLGSESMMVEGRGARLVWQTHAASGVSLDGSLVAGSDETLVSPTATTLYQLESTGPGVVESAEWTIEVIREPRIDFFTVEPFDNNGVIRAAIQWQTTGATSVSFLETGEPLAERGTMIVTLLDPPVWTLIATNEWGSSLQSESLSAVGGLPYIVSYAASPNPFAPGEPVHLSYQLFNADSATIEPGVGAVDPGSGDIIVFPPNTTSYTLTATNAEGSVSEDLLVEVVPPRIDTFVANPAVVFPGESTTLRWVVGPGLDLVISPDVGAVFGEIGTVEVTAPADSTVYTLTASHSGGSASAETVVRWKVPEVDLSVSDETPFVTDTVEFVATIEGADTATLNPIFGSIDPAGGSYSTTVSATTDFVLRATNAKGFSRSFVRVTPKAPVVAISASDATPWPYDPIDLNLSVAGAETATLEPGFGAIDPVDAVVSVLVEQPTTFVLTGISSAGTVTAEITIDPKLPTASLVSSSVTPFAEQEFTLTATAEGATSLTLEPGFGAIDPAGGVFPTSVDGPTNFVLTASNARGSRFAHVQINPKLPTANLTVSNAAPFPQDPIDLAALMQGATSATLEPGFGSISPSGGVFSTAVPVETTFVLTATNALGSISSQVTVQPTLPAAELSATPLTPTPGQTVEFTVVLQGADSASLEPLFGPIPVQGGVFSAVVDELTTVVLTATNTVGSVTRELTIVPNDPQAPTIVDFSSNKPAVNLGEAVVLSWEVENADAISIEPGGFTTTETSGSINIFPTEDSTTYILMATNALGSNAAQVVVLRKPFEIVSFTASPGTIDVGQSSTLSWQVLGTGNVFIDGVGPQTMSGTAVVLPEFDTIYSLRVTNGVWTETVTARVNVIRESNPTLQLSWAPDQPQSYPDVQTEPGVPFHIFVLALDPPVGVLAYEFGLQIPGCVFVLGVNYNPPGSINVGPTENDFIVGTGECLYAQPVVQLMDFTFLSFDWPCIWSTWVGVGPSVPSTFGDTAPGMLTCLEQLVPFVPGFPLWLQGGIVPAVTVSLELQEVEAGLEARWQLPENVQPSTVRILRAESDEIPRELASLSGSAARTSGSYVDRETEPGVRYRYRVIAEAGEFRYSSEEVEFMRIQAGQTTVLRSRLLGNVPNPFNPQTEIRFELARDGAPRIEIFDSAGRRVRSVQLGNMTAGAVQGWVWNGEDEKGLEVSSGVYHVRLLAGDQVDARSISLIR